MRDPSTKLQARHAADLPYRALQKGAKLAIVNRKPTYLDTPADVVFSGDVAEFLPLVAREVLLGQ